VSVGLGVVPVPSLSEVYSMPVFVVTVSAAKEVVAIRPEIAKMINLNI
jgi:hypothetical protein